MTEKDILYWKIGYAQEGRYGGRIIIPSFNNDGDMNYFISRSYVQHKRKYLNTPVSKNIIFNELCIDWDEPIVLVEGVFDAIVAGQNSIPILGSTMRPESKLFQAIVINDTPVYLALDNDVKRKTNQIIKNMLKYDLEVYMIDTSGCQDVGSMSKEEFLNRKSIAKEIDQDYLFMNKLIGGLSA